MKAFVHIGLPHAASSHIEFFLLDPGVTDMITPTGLHLQQRVGKDFRLSYLEETLPGVMTAALQRSHAEYVVPLLEEGKNIMLSEEHFGDPEKFLQMAPLLGQYLEGFDVEVLLVTRRQDRWLESKYGQSVKDGGTLTFREFLAGLDLDKFHWLKIADAYAALYPVRAIPLGGSDNDITVDLFKAVGIEIDYKPDCLVNPSLPMHYTEALRVANAVLGPEHRKELADVMVERLVHTTDHRPENDYFTPAERKVLLDCYKESNDAMHKAYSLSDGQ